MPVFTHAFTIRATLEAVSDFHRDTQALKALTPPPIVVQLHRVDPLSEGSISEFTLWFGPLPIRWKALHRDVDPRRGFTDVQVSGPMRKWVHTHMFHDLGDGRVQVSEHIGYEHFGGWRGLLSRLLFAPLGLRFLFLYREWVTRRAVEKSVLVPSAPSQTPARS